MNLIFCSSNGRKTPKNEIKIAAQRKKDYFSRRLKPGVI